MLAHLNFIEKTNFAQQIMNSEFMGIAAWDTSLRIRAWNPVLESITGLSAQNVIDEEVFRIFPFLKDNGDDEMIIGPLNGHTGKRFERPYFVEQTGRKGFFDGSYKPLYNQEQQIVGGILEVREVSEMVLNPYFHERGHDNHVDSTPEVVAQKNIGLAIQQRRKALGLSQEKFADICDLHRTYISDIERGSRNIGITNFRKIATALELSPWVLLGWSEHRSKLIEREADG